MLNGNNDNIEPNTEVEGIGRIDNKAVGKQKPKKEKRNFGCNDCGKIFRCDRDFTDHRNGVHLGLKNYHCSVPGCQKSYSVDAERCKRNLISIKSAPMGSIRKALAIAGCFCDVECN